MCFQRVTYYKPVSLLPLNPTTPESNGRRGDAGLMEELNKVFSFRYSRRGVRIIRRLPMYFQRYWQALPLASNIFLIFHFSNDPLPTSYISDLLFTTTRVEAKYSLSILAKLKSKCSASRLIHSSTKQMSWKFPQRVCLVSTPPSPRLQ